jgi:uncharacterized protein (TIGR02996 family)
MSDADALLDAIFAAPADDTPRLVYADYLQEHGQEHYAEFIRLQCAAARCRVWSAEANGLWERIGRVWARLADEWWPATAEYWPGIPHGHINNDYCLDAVHFDRGLLRPTVAVTAGQVRRYAACRAWLPSPLSGLVIDPGEDDPGALAAWPLLRRVRVLRCGDVWAEPEDLEWDDYLPEFRSGAFEPLLRSPHLCRVRVLDLSQAPLQRSTADLLLTAPGLSAVEDLEVGFADGGDCDPIEVVLQLRGRFKRVAHYGPRRSRRRGRA